MCPPRVVRDLLMRKLWHFFVLFFSHGCGRSRVMVLSLVLQLGPIGCFLLSLLLPSSAVSSSSSPLLLLMRMMTSSNGNIFRVLALRAGNSPVTGEFPSQRQVTRWFDVSFDLRLNKHLGKQWRRRRFETPSSSLWRSCNGFLLLLLQLLLFLLLLMLLLLILLHDLSHEIGNVGF